MTDRCYAVKSGSEYFRWDSGHWCFRDGMPSPTTLREAIRQLHYARNDPRYLHASIVRVEIVDHFVSVDEIETEKAKWAEQIFRSKLTQEEQEGVLWWIAREEKTDD